MQLYRLYASLRDKKEPIKIATVDNFNFLVQVTNFFDSSDHVDEFYINLINQNKTETRVYTKTLEKGKQHILK